MRAVTPKAKRSRGRPTKLDDVAAEKIVQAVRAGAYRKVAAVWAGVSPRRLRDWMAWGKERPKSPWGIFRRKVIEAAAAAEIAVGLTAFNGAKADPDYALRYLSVRWRKRWNVKSKLEVTGKDGAPLVPQADPSSLLEKLKKMEQLGAGEKGEGV